MTVAASILVGVAFVVAGVAKAVSPAWQGQAGELGVPAAVARAVPWFEIVLGAGLIAQVARTALAWTAVAVLAVFAVVLGSHLVRGRRPPCACFGGRHPRPISWWHVARNLALIAIAVVAAA